MNPANQERRDNTPDATKKNAVTLMGDKLLPIFGEHAKCKKAFLKSLKIV